MLPTFRTVEGFCYVTRRGLRKSAYQYAAVNFRSSKMIQFQESVLRQTSAQQGCIKLMTHLPFSQ